MELIGKANLRTVGLFQERAKSQAPFLHRHYPASTVLRACPPPTRPSLLLTEFQLRATTSHRRGFPCSGDFLFQACRRHYPDGTVGCCRCLAQRHRPSPKLRRVGFRHKCLFEACSAFTHVSACLFARSPKVTFTRVLQHTCYLLRRSGYFRPSDRLAGWDSHPLEIADFSRRTEFPTL